MINWFIMEVVASYFCESFSLVFISFGFKFLNAAQVNIMPSTCCIIVTGMVPFKILKNFIWFIDLSTWISKFATSFVYLTSDFVIWLFSHDRVEQPICKNEEANPLEFENPCLPLLHNHFPINHKTQYFWW